MYMARLLHRAILDSYKQQLKGIVDDLIKSSLNIRVSCRMDIKQAFTNNSSAIGLYIWYGTCKPSLIVEKWNERQALYEQFKTKNANANSLDQIKTSGDKLIDFLLHRINPQWERNPAYLIDNEVEIILYVGKAQHETLKNRLLAHYNGSIQTSALKLSGSSTNKLRRELSLIKEFLQLEKEILGDMYLRDIRCEVITFDESQKDRLLTYERILREYFEPIIGEE